MDTPTLEEIEATGESLNKITELLVEWLSSAKGQIDTLDSQIEEIRAKYRRLKQGYDEVVRIKNTELKWHQENAYKVEDYERLKQENEDWKRDYEDIKSKAKKKIHKLEQELGETRQELEKAKQDIEQFRQHTNNSTIHKNPITDRSREKSHENKRKTNREKVERALFQSFIDDYGNANSYDIQGNLVVQYADMLKVRGYSGLSEATIRDIVKNDVNIIMQDAQNNGWWHLYYWIQGSMRFCNTGRKWE